MPRDRHRKPQFAWPTLLSRVTSSDATGFLVPEDSTFESALTACFVHIGRENGDNRVPADLLRQTFAQRKDKVCACVPLPSLGHWCCGVAARLCDTQMTWANWMHLVDLCTTQYPNTDPVRHMAANLKNHGVHA